MKAFIIGGAGYIGSAAARALQKAGHQVSGAARSSDAADRMRALEIEPVAGDVTDPTDLARKAQGFDAVLFTPRVTFQEEDRALAELLPALEAVGAALIYTSGTAVFAQETPLGDRPGDVFAEADPFTPPPWPMIQPRLETEAMVLAAGAHMRAMIIRPPMVWGYGGSLLLDAIVASINRTGAACYVGEGLHRLSNVHVDDLGELHRLAAEKGVGGAVYHAAADEADFRTMAQWCAEARGCETRSVTVHEAADVWPILLPSLASSNRSDAARSRSELGWTAPHREVSEDLRDAYTGKIAGALGPS